MKILIAKNKPGISTPHTSVTLRISRATDDDVISDARTAQARKSNMKA